MFNKNEVIAKLKTVKDPELHLDIWSMGLIYSLSVNEKKTSINILMTYTTPFCPWGPELQEEIKTALHTMGAKKVDIELTFDPPYKMPEELRSLFGI